MKCLNLSSTIIFCGSVLILLISAFLGGVSGNLYGLIQKRCNEGRCNGTMEELVCGEGDNPHGGNVRWFRNQCDLECWESKKVNATECNGMKYDPPYY